MPNMAEAALQRIPMILPRIFMMKTSNYLIKISWFWKTT